MPDPQQEGTDSKSTNNSYHHDEEKNFETLGAIVRIVILVWSATILTLVCVNIPGLPQQKFDPTFIASVFTGTLATFGVQSANSSRRADPNRKNGLSKEDVESIIKASGQTVRIEHQPIKLSCDDDKGKGTPDKTHE